MAQSARILVINDTQEIFELFRDLLEGEGGYEVVLYSYIPQQIQEIEQIKPDLIILDLVFGQENLGWQTLQKLKMRRTTREIPVIVCTAAIREVRELEGPLKAKGTTVVTKPFDIEEMLDAVRIAFEHRKYMPPPTCMTKDPCSTIDMADDEHERRPKLKQNRGAD